MSILQATVAIPNISFSGALSSSTPLFLHTKFSQLSIQSTPRKIPPIRMGGGPRTFPGGVSKWQWKRMQAKKGKQLLKARLARERQIYEMRKRAELKAAVSELERPWEVVERAPNLFSVRADEQLKVLADRFQQPGGFDMWTERDGPQLFHTDEGLPSARFFPKGVVHSAKPYGKIALSGEDNSGVEGGNDGNFGAQLNSYRSGRKFSSRKYRGGLAGEGESADRNYVSGESVEFSSNEGQSGGRVVDKLGRNGNKGKAWGSNTSGRVDSGQVRSSRRQRGESPVLGKTSGHIRGRNGLRRSKESDSDVFDMSLQQDGSFGFEANRQCN